MPGAEDAPAAPPTPSLPDAPNDKQAGSLAGCTAGPVAPHPSVPQLTYLFSCSPASELTGIGRVGTQIFAALATTAIVRAEEAGSMPETIAFDPTPGARLDRMVVGAPEIFYVVSTSSGGATTFDVRVLSSPNDSPRIVKGFTLGTGVSALAQDADEVFVGIVTDPSTRMGRILAFKKKSFEERLVADGVREPVAIAVDGGHVYLTSLGVGILRVPKLGGASQALVSAPSLRLGALALGSSSGFVLDRGTFPEESDARIATFPKGGGVLQTLASAPRPTADLALVGADAIVLAGALPEPGDPGTATRPLRVTPSGVSTELLSPSVVELGRSPFAASGGALYVGFPGGVARLAL